MSGMEKKERILWIDIYKAIAITLVVMGHATGMFNRYIYQFHLAAFFFISGYVAKLDADGWIKTFIKKLYTLILPLFTWTVICGLIMDMLYKRGIYEIVFGDLPYIGFGEMLKQLLIAGNIYAWVLGAGWFLIILFFVSLISKILWKAACRNVYLFIGYITLLYIVGYIAVHRGIFNHIILAIIAQFFYSLGFAVKEKGGKFLSGVKTGPCVAAFVTTSLIIWYCGRLTQVTIDYVSGEFHNIYLNTFTSMAGIVWIFCLAALLGKIRCEWFTGVIVKIGQNTMGVVLLHFITFKLIAAVLYVVGIAGLSEIAGITPSVEIGNRFWWLYVLVSETICVTAWMLCKKIPLFNSMIGTDKKIMQKLNSIPDCVGLVKGKDKESNSGMRKYCKRLSVILLAGGYIVVLGNVVMHSLELCRALNIQFPVDLPENIVSFEDGWLPQGDEDYRWIADKGTMTVNYKRHAKLSFSGYVPENFTEITKLDVYIDEQLAGTIDVSSNRYFEVEYDISDMVDTDYYKVTFDFDGIHKPEEGSAEIRELSGMIIKIHVE